MAKPFSLMMVSFGLLFGCSLAAFAHEEPPKPTAQPPSVARKEMNLPPGAQIPKKVPKPSPKEKALSAQLQQLEKQRDALINKSAQLDRKRLSTQDPAERKRLDQQKLALVRELDEVVRKREAVYKAWQKAAMERWRKENPEAFQAPPGTPPGMPPGMPPQIIAKQIQVAEEQLAKLKKQGKPDTDPQVKMYKERIDRYKQMLKSTAAKPPAPSPAKPEK
ncbi:MAG: hypothetical protein RMM08_10460 [Armatimonadota bacterium]|nr:hypothetical protein [bacterium]MDW8321774.1 hypothetical protein [Armatimonadota bacterium]